LFDYAAVPLVSAVPVGLCFSPLFCHCNSSSEEVKELQRVYTCNLTNFLFQLLSVGNISNIPCTFWDHQI
jgi:hypothetical protein